jgi:hypothetical protein
MYDADIAFVEVTSGIYLVGKDRVGEWGPGTIVNPHQVRVQLRKDNYKIVLCKGTLDNIVYANFTLGDELK